MRSFRYFLMSITSIALLFGCAPRASETDLATVIVPEGAIAAWNGGQLDLDDLDAARSRIQTPACIDAARAEGGGTVEELVACYGEIAEYLAIERMTLAAIDDLDAARSELDDVARNASYQRRLGRITQAIVADIEVDDEAIRAEYEEHRDEYRIPARRTLWNIYRRHEDPDDPEATYALMREIKQRILGGEAFSALAEELSQSETRLRGGLVGTKAEEDLPDALRKVAFALESGGISEPVRVRDGAVLIHVTQIQPGAALPFEEVEARLRQRLTGLAAEERIAALAEAAPIPDGAVILDVSELESIFGRDDDEVLVEIGQMRLTVHDLSHQAGEHGAHELPEDPEQRERFLEHLRVNYEAQIDRALLVEAALRGDLDEKLVEAARQEDPELQTLLDRQLVDRRLFEAMEELVDAEPELVERHFLDNRHQYQSQIRFDLVHLEVPLDETDALVLVSRLEALREAVAAGTTGPEELLAQQGTVEELGWKDYDELALQIPTKAVSYLLQAEPGQLTVPYQDKDAVHQLWVKGRQEAAELDLDEAKERVRADYLQFAGQELYRRIADERLKAAGYTWEPSRLEESLR